MQKTVQTINIIIYIIKYLAQIKGLNYFLRSEIVKHHSDE